MSQIGPAQFNGVGPTGGRASRERYAEDRGNEDAQLVRRIRTLRVEPYLYSRASEDDFLGVALGVSKLKVRAIKRALEREVAASARAFLAEPEVAGRIANLPLRDGDAVVGLGDEMTSDRISWFEVLAAAHSLQTPDRQLRFVNMAAPGLTTAQMLDRMVCIRAIRPRIVLCMPGVHDARRSGGRNAPTVLSLGETDRNLFRMRPTVRSARWLWIVPPDRRPRAIVHDVLSVDEGYRWNPNDCRAIRALIRAQDEHVVEPGDMSSKNHRSSVGSRGEDPLAFDRSRILRAVLKGLEQCLQA